MPRSSHDWILHAKTMRTPGGGGDLTAGKRNEREFSARRITPESERVLDPSRSDKSSEDLVAPHKIAFTTAAVKEPPCMVCIDRFLHVVRLFLFLSFTSSSL